MSNGEGGLAVFFSATTILCLIAAAKAVDTPFAFHATLGAAASLWAVFAIFNRYFDRPDAPVPQEINGRPNYNLGPIKFASAISVFWGIAGFTVGLLIACQLVSPRGLIPRIVDTELIPAGQRVRLRLPPGLTADEVEDRCLGRAVVHPAGGSAVGLEDLVDLLDQLPHRGWRRGVDEEREDELFVLQIGERQNAALFEQRVRDDLVGERRRRRVHRVVADVDEVRQIEEQRVRSAV